MQCAVGDNAKYYPIQFRQVIMVQQGYVTSVSNSQFVSQKPLRVLHLKRQNREIF